MFPVFILLFSAIELLTILLCAVLSMGFGVKQDCFSIGVFIPFCVFILIQLRFMIKDPEKVVDFYFDNPLIMGPVKYMDTSTKIKGLWAQTVVLLAFMVYMILIFFNIDLMDILARLILGKFYYLSQ